MQTDFTFLFFSPDSVAWQLNSIQRTPGDSVLKLRIGGWLFNKRKLASTAGAQPALPADAATNPAYQANNTNEERPFVRYKVPFQAQKHVNMCGEACIVMLKQFKGLPPAINMDVNPRGVLEGVDGVITLANTHGLRVGYFGRPISNKKIAKVLTDHGPFICCGDYARFLGQRWGHFIVVTGVWGDKVMIHDPWHGENRQKSIDWFVEKYEGNTFAYIA